MLLSEIHPSIYRLSVGVHRAERRLDWLRQAGPEADADAPAVTPHTVVRHSSPLLRKLGAVDPALQRSKVGNLRLAAATIDGRVLAPGATFSFWRCIGNPSARRGYGPGLVLVHGRMSSAVGGGLCQLANLLHWMVLHTPLVIVEHHHHGYDPFPDSGRVLPFGSGATVFYNYVDYRFHNPGPETYRIRVRLTDESLCGQVLTDRMPPLVYHVREEGHRFFRREGQVYRENRLWRVAHDRATGVQVGRELLAHNVFPVLYEPAPGLVAPDLGGGER